MQALSQSRTASRISHLPPSSGTTNSEQTTSVSSDTSENKPLPKVRQDQCEELAEGVGLAHDAGNLLNALGLYCDLLHQPGVLRPEHRHYAEELRLLSQRSSTLIRRLLALPQEHSASSLSVKSNLTPAAYPIPAGNRGGRVEDLTATFRGLEPFLCSIVAPRVAVKVDLPGPFVHDISSSLQSLQVSSEILERVLVNLVSNAADAIMSSHAKSGNVQVSLATRANRLLLEVKDDGPGMAPAMAAAFLRPSPLPPFARRGLGHRIVHELVSSTGGKIKVVSSSKGTTIRIAWPLPMSITRTAPVRERRSKSTQGAARAC